MKHKSGIHHKSSFLSYVFCIVLLTSTPYGQADNTLRAATLIYPPYEYLEKGQPAGIATELIHEVSKRIGYKVTFDFFPWKRAVAMVEHGEYDLLFNAGKNRARQQWGRYVDSVLILQEYVLFKRKERPITIN